MLFLRLPFSFKNQGIIKSRYSWFSPDDFPLMIFPAFYCIHDFPGFKNILPLMIIKNILICHMRSSLRKIDHKWECNRILERSPIGGRTITMISFLLSLAAFYISILKFYYEQISLIFHKCEVLWTSGLVRMVWSVWIPWS